MAKVGGKGRGFDAGVNTDRGVRRPREASLVSRRQRIDTLERLPVFLGTNTRCPHLTPELLPLLLNLLRGMACHFTGVQYQHSTNPSLSIARYPFYTWVE